MLAFSVFHRVFYIPKFKGDVSCWHNECSEELDLIVDSLPHVYLEQIGYTTHAYSFKSKHHLMSKSPNPVDLQLFETSAFRIIASDYIPKWNHRPSSKM